jgi:hypothetical protein
MLLSHPILIGFALLAGITLIMVWALLRAARNGDLLAQNDLLTATAAPTDPLRTDLDVLTARLLAYQEHNNANLLVLIRAHKEALDRQAELLAVTKVTAALLDTVSFALYAHLEGKDISVQMNLKPV